MKDKIWQWIAWHLPHELAYRAAVRVCVWSSQHGQANTEMGAITFQNALEEWHARN